MQLHRLKAGLHRLKAGEATKARGPMQLHWLHQLKAGPEYSHSTWSLNNFWAAFRGCSQQDLPRQSFLGQKKTLISK